MSAGRLGWLDAKASRYCLGLAAGLRSLCGETLTGTYLHGSAALGDSVPGSSDIDLMTVVDRDLPDETLGVIREYLISTDHPDSVKGIDFHLVTMDRARAPTSRPPFLLHVRTFEGLATAINRDVLGDAVLPLHFAACRFHGIPLDGPMPTRLFAPVPVRTYLEAMLEISQRVWRGNPVFRVHKACRDLLFVERAALASKRAACRWALGETPYIDVVQAALCHREGDERPAIDSARVDLFAAEVDARVSAVLEGRAGEPPTPLDAIFSCHDERGPRAGPPVEPLLVSALLDAGDDVDACMPAVRRFLEQDYPHRELVVTGSTPVLASVDALGLPDVVTVRSVADDPIERLATAARAARGRLLAVWHRDAEYHPWRLSYQLSCLLAAGKRVSGTESATTVDADGRYEMRPPLGFEGAYLLAGIAWVPDGTGRPPVTPVPGSPADLAWVVPTWPAAALPCPHIAVLPNPDWRRWDGRDLGRDARATGAAVFGGPLAIRSALVAPRVPAAPEPGRAVADDHENHLVSRMAPTGQIAVTAAGHAHARIPTADRLRPRVAARQPLVSCLMPTFDRPRFARRAIEYFLRQGYPSAELVVVDDGTQPVELDGDSCESVRLVRPDSRLSIGAKRNLAVQIARGDVLVQWDDDDWYGPDRVAVQVAPLLSGAADITAVMSSWVLDLRTMRCWHRTSDVFPGLRVQAEDSITPGTMAFTRDIWEASGGQPDSSAGEDVDFIMRALSLGGRVAAIPNDGLYTCVRHRSNSWRWQFHATVGPRGWSRADHMAFLSDDDLAFYRAVSGLADVTLRAASAVGTSSEGAPCRS